MEEKLKACPFCGAQPTEYDQIGYSSVKCKPCNFSIKVKSMDGPPYAPELWNTRAQPVQGGEAVGVMHPTYGFCWYGEIRPPAGAELYTHPAAQVADGVVVSRFPMQRGPSIPWELAEALYAGYSAVYGTKQSLQRLAERGGFSWKEVEVMYANSRMRAAIDAALATKP